MSGPYGMGSLPECDGCGTLMVDWSDNEQAWLGKIDARDGTGSAEDYGGTTRHEDRLCKLCWETVPQEDRAEA